ncbi:hypothetical protein GCM10017714_33710 [Curtobacterium pusillum]|uniref:CHAP domain-containing protein n=1 Tax=Curtobacterium pusillum TaxID=69373 RepID=A0ABX2M3I1_9MICO|nr:hypothetical protein [Curtobacterium pusillum]NUU12705.1 hypothetical protein [Curtobacterium pusillum]GLK31595.1 hypothetical protein GCM10017610_18800 [Curtobacterium pusillum]
MTLTRTTPTAVAAYATSLIGRSRDHLPVPWTDSAAVDDCARFASHCLWGGFPISWVDNFKTAGDGSYAAGSGDFHPWDVLLFDWEHNGVGNHVEFFVGHDADPRYVRTYGANGSDTKAAAYRRRPVSYILGRFRPRWTEPAAPSSAAPHTNGTRRSKHMYTFVPIGKTMFVVSLVTGKRVGIKNPYHLELLKRARDNDGSDTMLAAELDIVKNTYLRRIA